MMTLSKQRKFTFNSLLEDIRGNECCVIKVRQYIFSSLTALKKNLMLTCHGLNLANQWYTSRSVTTCEILFQPIRGGIL